MSRSIVLFLLLVNDQNVIGLLLETIITLIFEIEIEIELSGLHFHTSYEKRLGNCKTQKMQV